MSVIKIFFGDTGCSRDYTGHACPNCGIVILSDKLPSGLLVQRCRTPKLYKGVIDLWINLLNHIAFATYDYRNIVIARVIGGRINLPGWALLSDEFATLGAHWEPLNILWAMLFWTLSTLDGDIGHEQNCAQDLAKAR